MAKQIVSISLDDETLSELDLFSEKLGLNRSAAVNLLISGCLGVDGRGELFRQMFNAMSNVSSSLEKSDAVLA